VAMDLATLGWVCASAKLVTARSAPWHRPSKVFANKNSVLTRALGMANVTQLSAPVSAILVTLAITANLVEGLGPKQRGIWEKRTRRRQRIKLAPTTVAATASATSIVANASAKKATSAEIALRRTVQTPATVMAHA